MSTFTILPSDHSRAVSATDAAMVFERVSRLKYREADILAHGEYAFSIRVGSAGFWSIYRREAEDLPLPSEPFG